MDDSHRWCQVNIAFPEWASAELTAVALLAPQLCAAEAEGLIDAWFFIRKHPRWRVRYRSAAGAGPEARIERHLDGLAATGHIGGWTRVVYEPEVRAFGGAEAMAACSTTTAAACWPTSRAATKRAPGTGARYPSCCAAS
jgi:thiopeptide-type bacteriocin biosynthesis protein